MTRTLVQARFARVGTRLAPGLDAPLGDGWGSALPEPGCGEPPDVTGFRDDAWTLRRTHRRWEFAAVFDLAAHTATGEVLPYRVWLPRVELKSEEPWEPKLVVWTDPAWSSMRGEGLLD